MRARCFPKQPSYEVTTIGTSHKIQAIRRVAKDYRHCHRRPDFYANIQGEHERMPNGMDSHYYGWYTDDGPNPHTFLPAR